MSAGSVSRIKGIIELRGKGSCECEFIRHLAPLTVGSIVRALPLEGRVLVEDEYVGLVTNLSIGAEKQRDSFKRGDMAFMVANNAICIFKKDVRIKGCNPVGKVTSNIEVLEEASMGDIMIIKS